MTSQPWTETTRLAELPNIFTSKLNSQLCLDNTMSTWAEKVVWLEISVHDPTDDYYEDYIGTGWSSFVGKYFYLNFRFRGDEGARREK